ncbi:MAG TPA: 1-acyl-sn-glycerol-3-phosphate acyltransferase [Planctomycetaceae bacterium]|nr:1-acyl-sn-glycerol-3-phosphate acyltransferase [Planctomycetaceae bacterium]
MQQVVFEDPYEFVPPYRGTLWSSFFRRILRWYLRRAYGVTAYEVRGVERLKESMAAGHGIILSVNHSRLTDPLTAGLIAVEARIHMYVMASWHIFKESRFNQFIARRLGAFSVYREGIDRKALNTAIDILLAAERPLVIYPEGAISRTNDFVAPLMEGVSFVARTAARRRAKAGPPGRVVIHPVALRYRFQGRLEETLAPALAAIEQRLSWHPQEDLPSLDRICKIGEALLTLKELEYRGEPHAGDVYDRRDRLVKSLLEPLEREWTDGRHADTVVGRVKNLRQAILPAMVERKVTADERRRRWKQLDAALVAQQISLYRRGYLEADSPPERLLETVQGFEEDLFDKAGAHGPWKVHLDIGEPLEVSPERQRGNGEDPLLAELHSRMQSLLDRQREDVSGGGPARAEDLAAVAG